MERVTQDELDMLIEKWSDPVQALEEGLLELPALTELRERRAAEREQMARITKKVEDGMAAYHKAPCPEHAKMVAELCPICGRGHNIGNPCYRIK